MGSFTLVLIFSALSYTVAARAAQRQPDYRTAAAQSPAGAEARDDADAEDMGAALLDGASSRQQSGSDELRAAL